MTLSAAEVDHLKKTPDSEGVPPAALNRWSPRAFADRDVSPTDLKTIFEAARWAASSSNEQPWRFLVGRRNSSTYQKIFSTLVPFNQGWAQAAPVLILGAAKNTLSQHHQKPNAYALHDLGAADATLALEAAALGLSTHFMGGFDKDAARAAFEIPEGFSLGAVIALGYQGEPATLSNAELIELEVAPRTRKPLSEFVFSAWEQPAELG